MKAIPTVFNGVQYRSRLEAKWASFFTLAGWRFEYEPEDASGWIPDFVLIGVKGNKIYVEVKPAYTYDELLDKGDKAVRLADNMDGEILLLGASLIPSVEGWESISLGVLYDGHDWADAAPSVNDDGTLDFFHPIMSFHHRISGVYEGDGHLRTTEGVESAKIRWTEATNNVQWKSPR